MRYVISVLAGLLIFAVFLGKSPVTKPTAPTTATTEYRPAPSTPASYATASQTPQTAGSPTMPAALDADSSECKATIERLRSITEVQFDKVSPSGENVFFYHAQTKTEVSLNCAKYQRQSIYLSWKSASPPKAWFDLASKAGAAVVGIEEGRVDTLTRRCIKAALKDKSELYDLKMKGIEIDCQAFRRDGGGTSVSLSKFEDEPEEPAPIEARSEPPAIKVPANEMGVQTHKWDGKTIETTAKCFYADQNEFRCLMGNSARIDFSDIEPQESRAFIESNCDTMAKAFHGGKCQFVIRLVYDGFDEMNIGGLLGKLTVVKARDNLGTIVVKQAARKRGR